MRSLRILLKARWNHSRAPPSSKGTRWAPTGQSRTLYLWRARATRNPAGHVRATSLTMRRWFEVIPSAVFARGRLRVRDGDGIASDVRSGLLSAPDQGERAGQARR